MGDKLRFKASPEKNLMGKLGSAVVPYHPLLLHRWVNSMMGLGFRV